MAKHTENISCFMEMTSMDVSGTRFLNALGTGMLRSPGPGCGQNRAFRGGGQMRGRPIYQQLWPAELRSGFRICSVESGEPLRLRGGAVGVGRAAAVSALNKLNAARVLNDYDFGGYLIWAASRPHTLWREILFRVQRRQRITGAG